MSALIRTKSNMRKIRALMNILDGDCSTSEGESALILDGESGDEMFKNAVETSERANPEKKKRTRRRRKVERSKTRCPR